MCGSKEEVDCVGECRIDSVVKTGLQPSPVFKPSVGFKSSKHQRQITKNVLTRENASLEKMADREGFEASYY